MVVHRGGLQSLVKFIGLDNFKRLLKYTQLKLIIQKDITVTQTTNGFHDFVSIQKGGKNGVMTNEEFFVEALERGSNSRGASRRLANQLIEEIEFSDFIEEYL